MREGKFSALYRVYRRLQVSPPVCLWSRLTHLSCIQFFHVPWNSNHIMSSIICLVVAIWGSTQITSSTFSWVVMDVASPVACSFSQDYQPRLYSDLHLSPKSCDTADSRNVSIDQSELGLNSKYLLTAGYSTCSILILICDLHEIRRL